MASERQTVAFASAIFVFCLHTLVEADSCPFLNNTESNTYFAAGSSHVKRCFYVPDKLDLKRMSYLEAEKYCESQNGSLASIHLDREWSVIKDYLQLITPSGHGRLEAWIGLNEFNTERQPQWTDQSTREWFRYSPNRSPTAGLRNRCYKLDKTTSIMDEPCDRHLPFVCQIFSDPDLGPSEPPSFSVPQPGKCGRDWYQLSDTKCLQVIQENMTYVQSSEACTVLDSRATLASVHSVDEMNQIIAIAGLSNETALWLGVKQIEPHRYGNVDGSAYDFENWASGYPSNKEKECVAIDNQNHNTGQWMDYDCETKLPAICQKNPDPAGTTYGRILDACPSNKDYKMYRGNCYRFSSDKKSWTEAENECIKQKGHLMSIVDEHERAILAMMGKDFSEIWIGMIAAIAGNGSVSFSWVDGSPIYFTEWGPEEPDMDADEGRLRYCTFQSYFGDDSERTFWSTTSDCSSPKPYVCKINLNPIPKQPFYRDHGCPDRTSRASWTALDDSMRNCYANVSLAKMDWSEAQRSCRAVNGTLPSIHNIHELKIFRDYAIRTIGKKDWNGDEVGVWLGLRQTVALGMHENWDNVDQSPVDFFEWGPDMPGDSGLKGSRCVYLNLASSKFFVGSCQEGGRRFICQISRDFIHHSAVLTTPQPPVTDPDGQLVAQPCQWDAGRGLWFEPFSKSDEDSDIQNCYSANLRPAKFEDAIKTCRQQGADLVSIHSYDQNNFLQQFLTSARESQSGNYSSDRFKQWLIGLREVTRAEEQIWSDGTVYDFDDYDFERTREGVDRFRCNVMDLDDDGQWVDSSCAVPKPYVCAKRKPGSGPKPDPIPERTVPGNCPEGWAQYKHESCLKFVSEPLSWQEARRSCFNDKAELVAIKNREEQDFLVVSMSQYRNVSDFWIGLKALSRYQFEWSDESSGNYYWNWASDEPKSGDFRKPTCAYVMNSAGEVGTWGTSECTETKPFICMKPADPMLPEGQVLLPACKLFGDHNDSKGYAFQFGDSCYTLEMNPKSWIDAEQTCQKLDGHLVSVNQDEYESALVSLIPKLSEDVLMRNATINMWLGLSGAVYGPDQDPDHAAVKLRWTDDTPVTITNWGYREPRFSVDSVIQTFCTYVDVVDGKWYTKQDKDCGAEMIFMCKRSKDPPALPDYSEWRCLEDMSVADQKSGSALWDSIDKSSPVCIHHGSIHSNYDWTSAAEQCDAHLAALPEFHSKYEIDLIRAFLKNNYKSISRIWLNLKLTDSGWSWESGTALDFEYWARGEPQVDLITEHEQCAYMALDTGRWHSTNCTARSASVVCFMEKIPNYGPSTDQPGGVTSSPNMTDTHLHSDGIDKSGLGVGGIIGILIAIVVLLGLSCIAHSLLRRRTSDDQIQSKTQITI